MADAEGTVASVPNGLQPAIPPRLKEYRNVTVGSPALTGGDVDANTLVSEEYLMTLERRAFCELVQHPKTQERILGMLSTGKPVRN